MRKKLIYLLPLLLVPTIVFGALPIFRVEQGGTGQNSSGWTGIISSDAGVWSASTSLSVVDLTATGSTTLQDLAVNGVFDLGGIATGDIDFNGNLALNIGSTNTDFTSGGGLTLAGNLTVGTTTNAGLFTVGTTSDAIFNITTEGNVGIGTTGPTYKLDVAGNIRTTTGNIFAGLPSQENTILKLMDTSQTVAPKTNTWALAGAAQALILTDESGNGQDFGFGAQSKPSLFIVPSNDITAYLKLTHNGTNGVLSTGKGSLILSPSTGNVGIGTTTPLAALHVYTSNATTTILEQAGSEYILEAKNATGTVLTIDNAGNLTSGSYLYVDQANGAVAVGTTTASGVFTIGTTTESFFNINTEGSLAIGTTTNSGIFNIGTSSASIFTITTEGNVGIGTTSPLGKFEVASGKIFFGDNANADLTQGLTINQGANTDQILAFKASGVDHGMTGLAETDTFGAFYQQSSDGGGIKFRGFAENTIAFQLEGFYTTDVTTKTTSSISVNEVRGYKKSGTGITDPGADANLFGVVKNGTTVAIIDAEGEINLIPSSGSNTVISPVASSYFMGGNVGIGTTTPSAILHAYTSATTTAILEQVGPTDEILLAKNATGTVLTIDNAGNLTVNTAALYVDNANQSVAIGTTTSSGIFNIGTSSDSIMTVTTEGNVGIGTTGPGNRLEVAATPAANSRLALFNVTGVLSDGYPGVQVYSNSAQTSSGAGLFDVAQDNASATQHAMRIYNDGSGNALYIDNNGSGHGLIVDGGNVGIGTTTPLSALHVYTSNATTTILEQAGSEYILEAKNATGTVLTIDNAGNLSIGLAGTTEGKIAMQTTGGGEIAPTIEGNVGNLVLTTSSGWVNLAADNGIQVTGNGNNIWWTANSGNAAFDFYNAAETTLTIRNSNGANTKANLYVSNGNIAIGTTTPLGKLDIANGDLVFTGTDAGLPFGEIYTSSSSAATDIIGTNNPAKYVGFTNAGYTNGMAASIASSSLEVNIAGTYKVEVSISATGGDNDTIEFGIYKNASSTELVNLHAEKKFSPTAVIDDVSITGFISVEVGDTIELWITNTTDTDDVTVRDMNMTLMMIGSRK